MTDARSGFNDRQIEAPESFRRKVHLLSKFPDSRFEAVVVQWSIARPTVFLQFKEDLLEPLQVRATVSPFAPLDHPLKGFVDPATGKLYSGMAYQADILFSERVFSLLQPEPDLVLPAEALWECRTEALVGLQIADEALPLKLLKI